MDRERVGVFVRQTAPRAPIIRAAPTGTTGFVGSFASGPALEPTVVRSPDRFRALFVSDGRATEAAVGVLDFFANGGRRAVVVRVSPETDLPLVSDLLTGLHTLLDAASAPTSSASNVQLVSIPDMARRHAPFSPHDYRSLVAAAEVRCAAAGCLLLVDPNTSEDDLAGIEDWLAQMHGWGSSDSAVYFPRLRTPAASAAGIERVPASGAVAGVMTRTDLRRGVWKAPAGVEATLDGEVTGSISDSDQSPLNRRGVNVIRSFPAHGTVIWGSRTSGGSVGDPYRHVPVRRTALFLEQSVRGGLRWIDSWKNGPELWREVRLSVANFLEDLWRSGAFVGERPDDAYFVRLDRSTMTRVDIRRGRLVLKLGFAPLRPAEFVVLTVTVNR